MRHKRLTAVALGGVLAALVFVGTLLLRVPAGNGYLHLGDAGVFLAASLLPLPVAFFAAALGASLADLLGGFAAYMPATFLLKGLMTLFFVRSADKVLCRRNGIAAFVGAGITAAGYFAAEAALLMLSGSGWAEALAAAVLTVPGNVLQGVANAALYLAVGAGLDRTGFAARLSQWKK